MEFCEICDNMYYIKIDKDDDDKIIYSCNNCNNEVYKDLTNNNCIYNANYSIEKKSRVEDFINQYTHLDPTLPRINNMECPNQECPTNTGKEKNKEVIYIKYDSDNMRFLYLCCHCKQCWKNDIDGVSIIRKG